MISTAKQPILIDTAAGIATLTLNRPEKLNALSSATIDALQRHLDSIERDDSIHIVILTGAGDKAFSAGAEAGMTAAMREFAGRGQALIQRIENFPKPIIAAVNGLAFGGGCEIVEACPLAIASEHARFARPEINLSFRPTSGETQHLPRPVGRKRALQLILPGDPISAEDAVQIGLINEIVPAPRLLKRARQLAATILGKPPAAIGACLANITRGINLPIDEGQAAEAGPFVQLAHTADVREGIGGSRERWPAPLDEHR